MAKPSRKISPPDESETLAAEIIEMMMTYGRAQFGDAVKSYWVYADELCPGCRKRPIDAMKYKGKEGLAINSFIYRERGVLIGYLLCGQCAKGIYEATPRSDDELHQNILILMEFVVIGIKRHDRLKTSQRASPYASANMHQNKSQYCKPS